ncbi:MAG: DUF72 domain-containing protein [Deltaproteobacteria bacterium]|nr:DUF72 domain-containing protein [Deltaproteobacteria bacterium]
MDKKQPFYIGTSGWTYDDWSGTFYPKEVKAPERLSFYAGRFNTVEINATFYRLPTQPMVSAWNRRLGEGFHLVAKGSRVVTHLKKLENCLEPLQTFLDRVLQLTRLEVILWQLPPSLHKDRLRLERFLSMLPRGVRHAVEFRHKSWWDEETAELLASHEAAFVAVSHPKLPETIYPTTDFLYVRFHGKGPDLYRYDYSHDELLEWVRNMEPHLQERALYAFFNNDYNANAVRNALVLREILSQSPSGQEPK